MVQRRFVGLNAECVRPGNVFGVRSDREAIVNKNISRLSPASMTRSCVRGDKYKCQPTSPIFGRRLRLPFGPFSWTVETHKKHA